MYVCPEHFGNRTFQKKSFNSMATKRARWVSVQNCFCNKAVYPEGLEANSAYFLAMSFLSPANADVTWSEFIVTSRSSAKVSTH